MRNGGTVNITIEYDDVSVDPPALVDPPLVEVEMRDPEGVKVVWTFGTDIELVKTAPGLYRMTSPPLDAPAGGVYTFIARGTGYPEAKSEVAVEASYW